MNISQALKDSLNISLKHSKLYFKNSIDLAQLFLKFYMNFHISLFFLFHFQFKIFVLCKKRFFLSNKRFISQDIW